MYDVHWEQTGSDVYWRVQVIDGRRTAQAARDLRVVSAVTHPAVRVRAAVERYIEKYSCSERRDLH